MQAKKIWFSDFWHGFDPFDNYILDLLRECESFEVDPESPELLVFSNFGDQHLWKRCRKICWSSEPYIKPPKYWNHAFSAFHFRPANYLPIWAINYYLRKTVSFNPANANTLKSKSEFCNFIYSNPKCKIRNDFFKQLHSLKYVHSGGKLFQNCDGPGQKDADSDPEQSKRQWQIKFRFSIAFENHSVPGYVSEKLLDAFSANTIPIYWGDPYVAKYFNTKSFVNTHEFEKLEDVVAYVLDLENSPKRMESMLREHPINESIANAVFEKKIFLALLQDVLNSCWEQRPVGPTLRDKVRHKIGLGTIPVIHG